MKTTTSENLKASFQNLNLICPRYDARLAPASSRAGTPIADDNAAGSQLTSISAHVRCLAAFCTASAAVRPLRNSNFEPANRFGRARSYPVRTFFFRVLTNPHEM